MPDLDAGFVADLAGFAGLVRFTGLREAVDRADFDVPVARLAFCFATYAP